MIPWNHSGTTPFLITEPSWEPVNQVKASRCPWDDWLHSIILGNTLFNPLLEYSMRTKTCQIINLQGSDSIHEIYIVTNKHRSTQSYSIFSSTNPNMPWVKCQLYQIISQNNTVLICCFIPFLNPFFLFLLHIRSYKEWIIFIVPLLKRLIKNLFQIVAKFKHHRVDLQYNATLFFNNDLITEVKSCFNLVSLILLNYFTHSNHSKWHWCRQ